MRRADRDEVWAAAALGPLDALRASLASSSHAWAWQHGSGGGEVLAVGGVSPGPGWPLGDVGGVWMLGSVRIARHPAAFLRMSLDAIARALAAYPVLVNVTDVRHTASHRWLRWLGATFGPPVSFGPFGMPFLPFRIEARPSCATP